MKKACIGEPRCKGVPVARERCKRCYQREYMRTYDNKWKKKDPTRPHGKRDWHLRNPEKAAASNQKFKLSRYGLTPADYNERLKAQAGVCAICQKKEVAKRSGRTKALAVDHDHKTGAVRGLLCTHCNTGLAMFKDDRRLLALADAYIASHVLC